jgi:hypothetical protein
MAAWKAAGITDRAAAPSLPPSMRMVAAPSSNHSSINTIMMKDAIAGDSFAGE